MNIIPKSSLVSDSKPYASSLKVNSSPYVMKEARFLPQETPAQSNFAYLYKRGIIDIEGKLTEKYKNINVPTPSAKLILQVWNLLHSYVIAGTLPIPKVGDVLIDLLNYHNTPHSKTPLPNIEIVGGFLRYLILSSPELISEILQSLQICPTEIAIIPPASLPPDCDIRCNFPQINDEKTDQLTRRLLDYVKSAAVHAFDSKVSIAKKNFYHYDGFNKYGVLTFRGPTTLNYEFLIIQELKRKSLFVHDALRLDINCMLGLNNGCIQLVSDYGIQPIIDLLLKVVHIQDPRSIDDHGWPILISYFTRGYTCPDLAAEEILRHKSCTQNLPKLLKSCIKNHHAGSKVAEIAILFNASVSLGTERTMIKNLWDKDLLSHETSTNEDLLCSIVTLIQNKQVSFEVLLSCIEIFALFHLQTENKDVNLVRHHHEIYLQILVRGQYLLLPCQIAKSLQRIENENTDDIFETLYRCWKPSTNIVSKSQLEKNKSFLNLKDLKIPEKLKIGLHNLPLKTILQKTNPDNNSLQEVCRMLPNYLKDNCSKTMKDYAFTLLINAFPMQANLFNQAKDIPLVDFTQPWILLLAETQDPSLCQLSYQIFLEHQKNASEAWMIEYIGQLLPQDPYSAWNVFNKLKCFEPNLFIRITNTLQKIPGGSNFNLMTCKPKIEKLLRTDFESGYQVISSPNCVFHCDLELTSIYLSEANTLGVERHHVKITTLLEKLMAIVFLRREFPGDSNLKTQTCDLILFSLEKILSQQILMPRLLIQQLENNFDNICMSQAKPDKLYNAFILLINVGIAHPKNGRFGIILLDCLKELLKEPFIYENIFQGFIYLQNFPDLSKDEISKLIRDFRSKSKRSPVEEADFFLNDLPLIYGNGFENDFAQEAGVICGRLAKKEPTIDKATLILKKYNVPNREILWNKILQKINRSKNKDLRLQSLPLLLENNLSCDLECWIETLKTMREHKEKYVFAIFEKIYDPTTQEEKLLKEIPLTYKIATIETLLKELLARSTGKTVSENNSKKIWKLRELYCNTLKKKPDLALEIEILKTLSKAEKFDQNVTSIISDRFNEFKNADNITEWLEIIIRNVKLFKANAVNYKELVKNCQEKLHLLEFNVMDLYLNINYFTRVIEAILSDVPKQSKDLCADLVIESLPLMIDFTQLNEESFIFKLLSSDELKGKIISEHDLANYWGRLICSRLRTSLFSHGTCHKDELIFFNTNKDKLSKMEKKAFKYAIKHFCQYLIKESEKETEPLFGASYLATFRSNIETRTLLIRELISLNPETIINATLVCAFTANELTTNSHEFNKKQFSELIEKFIYMTFTSPALDASVLSSFAKSVIDYAANNKLFSKEKMIKWYIFHRIPESDQQISVSNDVVVRAYEELLNDMEKYDNINSVGLMIEILYILEEVLIKNNSRLLSRAYLFILSKIDMHAAIFKKCKEVIDLLKATIEKLANLKKNLNRNKDKIQIATIELIQKKWKEVLKKLL
jgi:hypothetical protein